MLKVGLQSMHYKYAFNALECIKFDYVLWFKIVLNVTFTFYFFIANFVCSFLFAYYTFLNQNKQLQSSFS